MILKDKRAGVRNMTVTAMLSAIAFVLMYLEISIPVVPSFLKLDFSDVPALIASFSLGPAAGVVTELMKNLLHILFKGTMSAGVGELSNFLLGASMCLTAGLIYQRHRTRRGAVVACLVGSLVMAVACIPANYFLVYPVYVKLIMPMDAIIGMYEALLDSVAHIPTKDVLLNCLIILNLPFTLAKGILCDIIVMAIYKPLSPLLKGRKTNDGPVAKKQK